MGSSSVSQITWIVLAAVGGILFLTFDAIRYFAQEISPVTLRRWSGDQAEERSSRWLHFDPRNLTLVSGSLLQIALIGAFIATIRAFDHESIAVACGISAAIWFIVVIVWKFVLAFVPEDIGEMILKALIPFSHFFYLLFWPVLFPLRRVLERLDREEEEAQRTRRSPTKRCRRTSTSARRKGSSKARKGR